MSFRHVGSYPDPSIRGICGVGTSGPHPHVLPRTLRCGPSFRLAPASFSTARISNMLCAYLRIMVGQGTVEMATGIHYDTPVFPKIERERPYRMLAFLRHRKRSGIIVFFVAMIVLVFVLWGVGRYINEPGSESLAKVNGESISPTDFAFHYQRLVDQYKNLLKGSLTEETLKNLNLRGLVIQELVRRQLLLQEA